MDFRSAKPEDLSVIISWIPDAAACKRWAGPAVSFPPTPASLVQEIDFSDHNSYCLQDLGAIVGFGQMIRKSEHRIHLARIIVAPRRRGRGYGRHLCRSLMHRAAELKYPRISLNVYRDNPAAVNLYHRLGFRAVNRTRADGISEDLYYMEAGPQRPS